MSDIHIDPLDNRAPRTRLAWEREVDAICAKHGALLADVVGPRRFKPLIPVRREIAVMLIQRGWSYTKVAKFMNRDHTTIIHQYRMGIAS